MLLLSFQGPAGRGQAAAAGGHLGRAGGQEAAATTSQATPAGTQ